MSNPLLSTGIILLILVFSIGVYLYQKKRSGHQDSPARMKGVGFLKQYTTDFTERARLGQLDPVTGRDEEIERVIHILMRRVKNNPLLLGEPGVGKTAVIEGLAQDIVSGKVPEALKGKKLLALEINALISNTKYRGELESRLQQLTEELQIVADQVILFIDEIHLLSQVGGAEGSLNVSDVIKPSLARGELQIVGATTWSEYEQFIRPDAAFDRRLQPVLVDEPTVDEAIKILRSLRGTYEEFHNVKITDEAVEAAVRLSDEKIDHRFLPDKAIDLIDEASAKVSIEASMKPRIPMGVMHAASIGDNTSVDADDIREVIEQWVVHSSDDAKRDARQE